MLRYPTLFAILLLATVSCSSPDPEQQHEVPAATPETGPATPAAHHTIVPGERIGRVSLGQLPEQVDSILGKPDMGDAAMGKALSTWYSDSAATARHQLNIYFVRTKVHEQEAFRVQQIRVTSPEFATASGLHTGTNLDSIRHQFPLIRSIAYYPEGLKNRV